MACPPGKIGKHTVQETHGRQQAAFGHDPVVGSFVSWPLNRPYTAMMRGYRIIQQTLWQQGEARRLFFALQLYFV